MTWSEETRRIFGVEEGKKQFKSDDFLNNFPQRHQVELKGSMREALSKGKGSFTLEIPMKIREKTERTVSLICQFQGEKGRSPMVFGTIQDITELKRLREERENIFRLSLDMICIAGFDGYFRELNPAWERILAGPIRN